MLVIAVMVVCLFLVLTAAALFLLGGDHPVTEFVTALLCFLTRISP